MTGRSGDAYNAHSYHTKVPPAAIARLICERLPQGGTVGDAFCGSGTTGIGAALAEHANTNATYNVVLGDLSPFAAFLSQVQNTPPAPAAFEAAAREMLRVATDVVRDLWVTDHHDGRTGTILYTIWSEVVECPACTHEHRFWDIGVDHSHGAIHRMLKCGFCGRQFPKSRAARLPERVWDPLIERWLERPVRVPVEIAYEVDGQRYSKAPDASDLARIAMADDCPVPVTCPTRQMLDREPPWGDLYRSGYHQGVTHVHHFYTRRNFITVGHLWNLAEISPEPEALRFLVSSYNLSHATLMSRIVFKRGQPQPVLTGYQTGALYISALPVEKNPLIGIARSKLRAVSRTFALTCRRRGSVRVSTRPAQSWKGEASEIDYFFLDPPFGGNIPYAEANFIAEAWLGSATDRTHEAIISKVQEKTSGDYRALLADCFQSLSRCLSTEGQITVMFHASTREPWSALRGALRDSGLETGEILLLDKKQSSFKQVRSDTAVEGDLLIDLVRQKGASFPLIAGPPLSVDTWLRAMLGTQPATLDTRATRRLYSEYVVDCIHGGRPLDVSAADFYDAVHAA